MLRGGSGGCTSAKWQARCMCLVLILEFLQFSIGSAIPSTKGYGAQVAPADDSSIAATRLRSYSNYCPASLLEVHSKPKGDLFPDVILKSQSYFSITGLQNLVRRFIAAAIATHQIQFGIEARMNSLPAEASHDDDRRQLPRHSRDDDTHAVTSSSSSTSRRLLLRGPAHRRNRRSSSPRYVWALNQQQRQQQRQGRRAMEEASRSPAGQQTQQVHLGPPAPAGLVHNEKQDWNQDYAEPDVHPPSSN